MVSSFSMGKIVPQFALMLLSLGATSQGTARAQTLLQEGLPTARVPAGAAAMPPLPKGRSTAIGGAIRQVDPVRDTLTLKVFGGQALKILFDERTQVYRDGKRIPVLKLGPEEYASIETTLDGTKIFALKIHLLSQPPEGDALGSVSSYNREAGELTIRSASSLTLITLRVPADTPVLRVAPGAAPMRQAEVSDLVPGSLVDATFKHAGGGAGVTTGVTILASPGSAFEFRGSLVSFDLHSGRITVEGAEDKETHDIQYDPGRFPISHELREGLNVKVTGTFDGSHYVARAITIE